jgi:hypothetical protein
MDATTVWLPLLLGGIFSLVGIGLFIFGLVQRNKGKQAEQWPTLPGIVVSSRVETRTSREHDDGRSYTRTTHMPVVEYTYEYMGKSYQGSRIFPGARMSFDLGTAQGIADRYQPGQACTVHYNPADLTDVVLETKSKGGSLMLILGAVFAVIGIVACCAGVGFLVLSA